MNAIDNDIRDRLHELVIGMVGHARTADRALESAGWPKRHIGDALDKALEGFSSKHEAPGARLENPVTHLRETIDLALERLRRGGGLLREQPVVRAIHALEQLQACFDVLALLCIRGMNILDKIAGLTPALEGAPKA